MRAYHSASEDGPGVVMKCDTDMCENLKCHIEPHFEVRPCRWHCGLANRSGCVIQTEVD